MVRGSQSRERVKASVFITCLVDQLYPQVGEAMVTVLRRLGVELDFPAAQTCCGQPAFNTGYRREARDLAVRFLHIFGDSKYIVVPSGSCAGMVKVFYPDLFQDDADLAARARALGERVYEFSQFLVHVLGVTDVGASFKGKATYHASCHLLRELGVDSEPLQLLGGVRGLELVEMEGYKECCGFGGTFSVKYPEISTAILDEKLRNIQATGADLLVACDSGCLMHMAGAMRRRGISVRPMHLAELLAHQEGT